MRPRHAAVSGPVNSIAVRDVIARISFAGSDPDIARVAWRNRYGADRCDGLTVEDGLPRRHRVARLPHTAPGRADIGERRIAIGTRDCGQSSTGERRTDIAPCERVHRAMRDGSAWLRRCDGARRERRTTRRGMRSRRHRSHGAQCDDRRESVAANRHGVTPTRLRREDRFRRERGCRRCLDGPSRCARDRCRRPSR